MSSSRYLLAVVVTLLVVPGLAFSGGFQINEHGTRAMGMGGAFSAQASDGSAMFYNPSCGLGLPARVSGTCRCDTHRSDDQLYECVRDAD